MINKVYMEDCYDTLLRIPDDPKNYCRGCAANLRREMCEAMPPCHYQLPGGAVVFKRVTPTTEGTLCQ